jgi:cell shape-determining protein MreC
MNRLPYLFLGLFLFSLLHLPYDWVNLWRSQAVATLAPTWQSILPATTTSYLGPNQNRESLFLQEQVSALQHWLTDEKRLQELSSQCAALLQKSSDTLKSDLLRRAERQKRILALRFAAMPAQVIFRDPSSWSSVLWIALGETDNLSIGRTVIERNSPVLFGNSLVGVVEYVGEAQSRVRLITDAGLVLAVRSLRGDGQNCEISSHAQNLLERVRVRRDLFSSEEEQQSFIDTVSSFQERLEPQAEEELLAKGELFGCSAPLWRSRGVMLKGSGFNYDYPDEEGPARDLRTGQLFSMRPSLAVPLLKEGDLLVTSGLDGVFPPGIAVAIATKIVPLKEGSCTYDLEARPAAGDLHDLRTVLVLPPVGCAENF